MRNPTPKVSGRYGAPMGRRGEGVPNGVGDHPMKYNLRRVRLNSGGYDDGGAYWGAGQPLYYFEDEDGNSGYFRALTRTKAKAHIVEHVNANAKFYR